MLLKHSVTVTLIIDKKRKYTFFNELKTFTNFTIAELEIIPNADSDISINPLYSQLLSILSSINICFLYELLALEANNPYQLCIRKVQQTLPSLLFFSFHFDFNNIKTKHNFPMSNTLYIVPTYSLITNCSNFFQISEQFVRVIYPPYNILTDCCPSVLHLHNSVNLMDTELLLIYPARLSEGKRQTKVAALAGTFKSFGECSTKVIFCDFPGGSIDANYYRKKIIQEGLAYGLHRDDIIFTSDYGYANGFPHKGVLDLFSLSNLFVCPSFSEAFSLIVLEASARGNFIVLNQSVPGLAEAGYYLNAYFMNWDARRYGYDITQNYRPNEQSYYKHHVSTILNTMKKSVTFASKTMTRRRFQTDWIYKNQLKPLLDLSNNKL